MNSKSFTALLFLSVCLIWGTTWFAMAKAFRQPLMFPKGKRHWIFIVAVLYFALPFTLMIYGEQYISSGLASIIFANIPGAGMLMSGLFLSAYVNGEMLSEQSIILMLPLMFGILLTKAPKKIFKSRSSAIPAK